MEAFAGLSFILFILALIVGVATMLMPFFVYFSWQELKRIHWILYRIEQNLKKQNKGKSPAGKSLEQMKDENGLLPHQQPNMGTQDHSRYKK
ncbi:MAG: hypothetical protein CSB34_06095 [Desulfobulbus propionicus]|nr:MAG: hypothetical protein CSB34_06095 [Desulfobulbus propionicus]